VKYIITWVGSQSFSPGHIFAFMDKGWLPISYKPMFIQYFFFQFTFLWRLKMRKWIENLFSTEHKQAFFFKNYWTLATEYRILKSKHFNSCSVSKYLQEFYVTRRYVTTFKKSLLFVSVLNEINPVHILSLCFFMSHFNIVLPSKWV
jgi:hypothetical protein